MLRRKRRGHDHIPTERRSHRANPDHHHHDYDDHHDHHQQGDPMQRQRDVLLRAAARQFYW